MSFEKHYRIIMKETNHLEDLTDGDLVKDAMEIAFEYGLSAADNKKEEEGRFGFMREQQDENDVLQKKLMKLKQLMLLTDNVVSSVIVGPTQLTQWSEFVKVFPDEGSNGCDSSIGVEEK